LRFGGIGKHWVKRWWTVHTEIFHFIFTPMFIGFHNPIRKIRKIRILIQNRKDMTNPA